MGRAFEYRKATKLKRWGHMAKTFTRLGKQIAIAVKAGGPEPENNPALRSIIATCKRENMPKDNIERAIKNAMGKDQSGICRHSDRQSNPYGCRCTFRIQQIRWKLGYNGIIGIPVRP